MKAGLLLALGAWAALAAALPAPAAVADIVLEDVKIYVNQEGSVISKTTVAITETPTQTQAPAEAMTSTPVSAEHAVTPATVQTAAASPSSLSHPSSSAAPPPPASSSSHYVSAPSSTTNPSTQSGLNFASGIAYSPYTTSGGCKSSSQIATDLAQLHSYSVIRLYGTDCNQIAATLSALHGTSTRIFAGIFDIFSATTEAQSLISQVGTSWPQIHTVSVGNEAVNDNIASVSQVTSAIGATRSMLRAAGYSGPVVTVDTMVALQANPALCQASDYCAMNCHAFFDGGVTAQQAGEFVKGWVGKVQTAVGGGKQVVVTESGWPSAGGTNKVAVPSMQNQKDAISSLLQAFPENLLLYTAYNNYWEKDSATTLGAEHFWGILGNAPSGA